MATTIDKTQIEFATKLSALFDKMSASQEKITQSYQAQIDIVEKLAAAMGKISSGDLNKELDGASKTVKKLAEDVGAFDSVAQKAFDAVGKKAAESGGIFKTMFDKISASNAIKSLGLTSDAVKKLGKEKGVQDLGNGFDALVKKIKTGTKEFIIVSAAIEGFYQGLQNIYALSKGVIGFATTFASGIINIGAAIVSIPFKIFTGLIDIADKANVGMGELRQAIENLRKEFGALGGPTPKTIKELSHNMTGFKETGLSTWRVFGNLAERLESFNKLAVGMGATFVVLHKEFVQNGGALLAYQKGLGVTDELMGAVAQRAISMGDNLAKTLKESAKFALDMGKAFGLDSKVLSKDMVKALQDVKHFANLSTKEISIAAVYSRKLGVELDKIVGTLDAFETFDSAAENAAKLSQAFGVQVDAFKLLEAENPADQIDVLRKAFKDAGQDASNFNRQQLKMIASTTGLDEATARQVFSQKNVGVSLDQIKKKAGESEKKTLTQAEAMKKLADSIERLVKTGGGPGGGFFDHFVRGLLGGIQSSKEFRMTILNIQRDLRLIERAGVQVGRAFVQMFPGVKDFFGGIKDLFDPKTFRKFSTGIVSVFKDFFQDLTSGSFSFGSLMDKLREQFFNLFDASNPAAQRIISGFNTTIKTITKLLVEGIKWASTQVAKYTGDLADFIANPTEFLKKAKTQGSGVSAEIFKLLKPIADAIQEGAEKIWPSVKKLFKVVWNRAVDFFRSSEFQSMIAPVYPVIAGMLFGPALTRALFSTLLTSVGSAALKTFTGGGFKKLFSSAATKGVESAVADASMFTKVLKVGGIVTAILATGVAISEGITKYKDKITGDISNTQKEIAAGTAGILDTLTLGLLPESFVTSLAQGTANILSSMEKTFNNLAGGLGTGLTDVFGGVFRSFEGIGDVVLGIFDGDIDKIIGGLGKMIGGLASSVVSLLYGVVPSMAIGIFKFSGILVGKTLEALVAIPKAILKFFGFDAAAAMLQGVQNFFKDTVTVFSKEVDKFGQKVATMFSDISHFWTQQSEKTIQGVRGLGSNIADAQTKALESTKSSFEKDPTGFISASQSVVDGLANIKEKLSSINLNEVAAQFKELTNLKLPDLDIKSIASLDVYSQFFDHYTNFLSSTKNASNSINKQAIASSIGAVQSMIDSANKLQAALGDGNINKIDISARLNKVAEAAGLGSKGEYTIKNKDVVINVSFTVYMDVAEAEKIMITQQKSIIRDRLNFIGSKNAETSKQPSFPIKTGVRPSLVNGGEG